MGRPRILIADDHNLVVEGFQRILESHFEVVGSVGDGHTLLTTAPNLKPDVILIDIGMPLLNGLEAGRQLKSRLPGTKFIVITMNEDPEVAAEAMRSWASGYILKKCAGTELIRAIREVLRGSTYVTPKVAQQLLDRFVRDPRPEYAAKLTSRQREVLQLLAEGKSMKEAADILHITPRTIAFHKYRIMEEFGLKTNSDLLVFAIREHLISA